MTEKVLMAYNDVFADIINVIVFGGKHVVEEGSLSDAITHSMYKADNNLHEQNRDVAKYWNNNEVRISLFGIENQTEVETYMPFRVIGYDGAAYRSQLLAKETHKVYPVVTLVLHFGTKNRWSAPTTLKGCLPNVPKELDQFISDYKMNVVDVAFLDDETVDKFTSDFKIVAKYFVGLRKGGVPDLSDDEIKHVDEVLKLMQVLTGDDSFVNTINETREMKSKKGAVSMNTYFSDAIAKGRQEGIEKGRQEGIEEGIEKGRQEGIEKGISSERDKAILGFLKNGVTDDVILAVYPDADLSKYKARLQNSVDPCKIMI